MPALGKGISALGKGMYELRYRTGKKANKDLELPRPFSLLLTLENNFAPRPPVLFILPKR